ncbi:MAG TPA: MMPL family transporter [Planctomycetes bacterium]|nr:MMPL family transporter [Planctomycetota bacterium]
MFFALGRWVARHWLVVTFLWVAIVVFARVKAPEWNSVAYDGDLAYLPAESPSVKGRESLAVFGENRARSQVVLVFEQQSEQPTRSERYVQWRISRDLQFLRGVARLRQAQELQDADQSLHSTGSKDDRVKAILEDAEHALNEAVYLDELLDDRFKNSTSRLAAAYLYRSQLYEQLEEVRFAREDRQAATDLDPNLVLDTERVVGLLEPVNLENWVDVWTWLDPVFGAKLVSRDERAKLIVVQLANEFLAIRNKIDLDFLHGLVATAQSEAEEWGTRPTVGVSGSAALGGDLLRSAKECIQHTEWFTIVLVVLILAVVYRSPMLVIVPLLSIGVAMAVSVALISAIAYWSQGSAGAWWELKIFTTTRIFVVVILFGASTDYCLFLISRYREELQKTADRAQAMACAMRGVGEALSASALTTIVGLGMMWFADFGKFRFSGPVIGLALFVSLVTCLTLTPAILYGFSRFLFWPGRVVPDSERKKDSTPAKPRRIELLWQWTADSIVRRPLWYLVGALLAMLPLAVIGTFAPRITYNSLASLDPDQPSRVGAEIMRRYFSVGESSPITVLVNHPRADFSDFADQLKIRELTSSLYEIAGVDIVRSIIDPLGDFPPDRTLSMVDPDALRTIMSRPHRRTSSLFLGSEYDDRTNAARMDVIVGPDPFSAEAAQIVGKIERTLARLSKDTNSFWKNTEFHLAGTTVGIRDLRDVTQSDTVRIRWLTVLAVYLVLLVITRRAGVSAYMIASVLLTYLVTLGSVWLLFNWIAGDDFPGLDWRVPLFLFVILVAIGQDYNVYLAMRVFEEQRILGPIRGVRQAVIKTGGIITSCGLVMAGTFFSMTATAWSPWLGSVLGIPGWSGQTGNLQAIVQLGAALSLGVVLDTFIVRSVLLPSFLVLLCHLRWNRRR